MSTKKAGKQTGYEQVMRMLAILAILDKKRRTVEEIAEGLRDILPDKDLSKRTLQRNLNTLRDASDLVGGEFRVCGDGANPQGWYREQKIQRNKEDITIQKALALVMVNKFCSNAIPPGILDYLDDQLQTANLVLQNNHVGNWPNRVIYYQDQAPRKMAQVKKIVLREVYQAVLCSQKLKVTYYRLGERNQQKRKSKEVYPLGLVMRHYCTYVIVRFDETGDAYQLRLDRIENAVCTKDVFTTGSFDLARWASENMDYPLEEEPAHIVLDVDKAIAATLEEAPLEGTEEHKWLHPEDRAEVTLLTPISEGLISWILARCSQVTVKSPERLRVSIREKLEKSLANYQ